MTPIVKAAPADLIALAWYQMGYRPDGSLVMVGLRGARQRAGVVARGDLPPRGHERDTVLALAGPLLESGADAAALLVCSADACRADPPRVLRSALRLLPEVGLHVVDCWAVGDTGYRSYRCTDPGCCPRDGRPLEEVFRSRVAAELVLQGCTLAPDESSLVADVRPAPDAEPDARSELGPDVWPGTAELPPAEEVLARWRQALAETASGDASGDLTAERAGERPGIGERGAALVPLLGPALADVRLRDAVMVTLVPGADRVADTLLRGQDGDGFDRCLRTPPDHPLLDRGVRLLAAAARTAPAGLRAGPLGALAWLAWWSGQGARARLLAERALADAPQHRLAMLVDGLLELAVPPPWAAREKAS